MVSKMNQTRYDLLYKRLRRLPFLVNKHDLENLEELWKSYLTIHARCERLEKELYELKNELKEAKYVT